MARYCFEKDQYAIEIIIALEEYEVFRKIFVSYYFVIQIFLLSLHLV